MFRGKESSNRIELSRLVQDLLNFGILGSLWLWGWGGWVYRGGGWLGGAHTHVHMHARMCMHAHVHMVNMIISCKWLAPLGESLGIPYVVICTCACVCKCVGGTLSPPPPTSTHPPPPRGAPPESIKIL